jgi:hypothetical protein
MTRLFSDYYFLVLCQIEKLSVLDLLQEVLRVVQLLVLPNNGQEASVGVGEDQHDSLH